MVRHVRQRHDDPDDLPLTARLRDCRIEGASLAEVNEWLEHFRKLWDDRFERLDEVLHELKKKEQRS